MAKATGKEIDCTNDKYVEKMVNDENYIINRDGTIDTYVSTQGHITTELRSKSISKDKGGYLFTGYYGKKLALHRIMYLKFNGPLNNSEINHKDGNPGNCDPSNLELSNRSHQQYHSFRVLKRTPSAGYVKYSQDDAKKVRDLRAKGATYKEIMKETGMCKSTVSYIVNNKTWSKKTTKCNPDNVA